VNDDDRGAAPLPLYLDGEEDCPVCGLGNAFAIARNYEVCARCGWVDDPAAIRHPAEKSDTNDDSLNDARRAWPKTLIARLLDGPLSIFDITVREDEIGGRDYVIDGAVLRDSFRAARSLKASIGPWPAVGDWSAPLRTGSPQTPTGRTRLYVCPLCGGDDYEISVTADVHVSEDRVIWSRIGRETYNYMPEGWELNLRSGPVGFAFDAREYEQALR
jgi:hypothetical protein